MIFLIFKSVSVRVEPNAEMKVQKLNHKILSSMGMCLSSEASDLQRMVSFAFNVVITIFIVACSVMPSVVYMYMNANNLQNCLQCTYQVVAFISCAIIYMTFAMQKSFVHTVYANCSRIATQRERWANDLRYERTERKCYYGAFVLILTFDVVFVGNSITESLRNIISGYLNGRLEPSEWYAPYKMM